MPTDRPSVRDAAGPSYGAGRLPHGLDQRTEPGIPVDGRGLPRLAGRRQEALDSWRRDGAVNPWRSDDRARLAALHFQARDWHAATQACREALRLNPTNLEVRKLLVRCDLHLQAPGAARREFQTRLGFDPPDRDELMRGFAPLSGPGSMGSVHPTKAPI